MLLLRIRYILLTLSFVIIGILAVSQTYSEPQVLLKKLYAITRSGPLCGEKSLFPHKYYQIFHPRHWSKTFAESEMFIFQLCLYWMDWLIERITVDPDIGCWYLTVRRLMQCESFRHCILFTRLREVLMRCCHCQPRICTKWITETPYNFPCSLEWLLPPKYIMRYEVCMT